MMEMLSRIRAVLRRAAPRTAQDVLRNGPIRLERAKHIVTVGGREVSLTLKEYDLLELFMENMGQAFSRDRLLTSVWGTEYAGETRTVDVHIGTLRTKLGSAGDAIRTVRGVGYRMEELHE
jgi:two-component system alkaline phosphatase synthesis response regulator PhoP